MRALTLTALLTALALPAVAQDDTRYAVDVTVMESGMEIASGRALIVEGGQAEILVTGADGQYHFTADLQPEQGDGEDDRLVLEARLNHDGVDLAAPTMILERNGRALMRVGGEGQGGGLTTGIVIALSPIPSIQTN